MTTSRPVLRQVRAEPANQFERWMTCTGCGDSILVCGAVSDLDPESFRGMACGCRGPRAESTFKRPSGAPDGTSNQEAA